MRLQTLKLRFAGITLFLIMYSLFRSIFSLLVKMDLQAFSEIVKLINLTAIIPSVFVVVVGYIQNKENKYLYLTIKENLTILHLEYFTTLILIRVIIVFIIEYYIKDRNSILMLASLLICELATRLTFNSVFSFFKNKEITELSNMENITELEKNDKVSIEVSFNNESEVYAYLCRKIDSYSIDKRFIIVEDNNLATLLKATLPNRNITFSSLNKLCKIKEDNLILIANKNLIQANSYFKEVDSIVFEYIALELS